MLLIHSLPKLSKGEETSQNTTPNLNRSQNSQQNTTANSNTHVETIMTSLNFTSLAKILNFSLPIKPDKNNFINWKAQMSVVIRAMELEDFVNPKK